MEQNCSNKIISLHMMKCEDKCHNDSSCYHLQKNIIVNDTYNFDIEYWLKKGYIIYNSLCKPIKENDLRLLELYKNYNITISCLDVIISEIMQFKNQIQLSVYDSSDLTIYADFQKLFLIKDLESYAICLYIITNNITKYGRIHFNIDQNTKNIKDYIHYISKIFNFLKPSLFSLDSCFTSWVINGKCPYDDNNYIDITYDGTARKCPFNKNGNILSNDTTLDIFKFAASHEKCLYKELLIK